MDRATMSEGELYSQSPHITRITRDASQLRGAVFYCASTRTTIESARGARHAAPCQRGVLVRRRLAALCAACAAGPAACANVASTRRCHTAGWADAQTSASCLFSPSSIQLPRRRGLPKRAALQTKCTNKCIFGL